MKKLLMMLLVLAGLTASGVYWFNHRRADPSKGPSYSTAPVEFGELRELVTATGVVQPTHVFPIGTEGQGRVVELLADFNMEVEEGAILARLDDRLPRQKRALAAEAVEAARKAVLQTQAARNAAQTAVNSEQNLDVRVRNPRQLLFLEEQLKATEAAIQVAEARVKVAQRELDLADLALQFTIIRAPSLGNASTYSTSSAVGHLQPDEATLGQRRKFLVLDRKVALGQMVGPPLSGHLFTLAGDLSTIQVEAQIAEGDLAKVLPGLSAEFTTASLDGQSFAGKVTDVRLLPASDRGAVFYKAIVEGSNQRDAVTGRWKLTPGLTVSVDVLRRKHDNVWKIPAIAFSYQQEEASLTPESRERLKKWQTRPDHEQWRTLWIIGAEGKPEPLFVRVGGKNASGQTGIRDLAFTECLEWDSELQPKPDPRQPGTFPQPIIAGPPPKAGLLNVPNIKF